MKRTLLALCTLALAAAPVLAGPVYLPAAIHETDGAYVRSDRALGDQSGYRRAGIRRALPLRQHANGTLRVAGDETGPYYLAPGESKRFTNLVPAGFRGMLELDGADHAAVQRRAHGAQRQRHEGRGSRGPGARPGRARRGRRHDLPAGHGSAPAAR